MVRVPAEPGRHRLLIAYDGTYFHGWQKQEPPGQPPLRTVAGEVERELRHLLGHPLHLVGASRTDTGVHAEGQVAHFDAPCRVPIERLADALNSRLPADIVVRSADTVDPTFHAIRGAVRKQYVYRFFVDPTRPLWRRHWVNHVRAPLDVDRMHRAAQRLVGTHDFAGLAAAKHGRSTTVRTIFSCDVIASADGREVEVIVEGDGFLYNMVRILAGTLMEVGRGRFDISHVDRILETADRGLAGPTLPPQGLCLKWIQHEPVEAEAIASGEDAED